MQREAICVAIIRNKKVLIVQKGKVWILPGGKPKEGEPDLHCLLREIEEEIPGIQVLNFGFYKEFEGRTPHQGDMLTARVYTANAGHGNPVPTAEINAIAWTSSTEEYHLSDITKQVIYSLQCDGFITYQRRR